MKKTFKMAVLAACTVLCWGFTSCFGFVAETSGRNSENTETQDENDKESLDDEQNAEPVKTPSPITNFKVTQKEGTNFLIFSWEKLEENDEICYWIDYENGPSTDYYYKHSYSSWEDNRTLDFETKEIYKEFLMFNQTHSGTYTFSIRAHEKTGYNDDYFERAFSIYKKIPHYMIEDKGKFKKSMNLIGLVVRQNVVVKYLKKS